MAYADNGGNLTISGVIRDNGSSNLVISAANGGSGTVTLSGANTYTGSTNITRGTLALGADDTLPVTTALIVDNSTANDDSILDLNGFDQTVASLAQSNLGGTGASRVINSSVTSNTLTVSGNLNYSGTLQLGVDGVNDSADLVAVGGNLDITNTTLDLSAVDSLPDDASYTLLTYGGTLTGAAFAGVIGLPAGYELDFSTSGAINLVEAAITTAYVDADLAGTLNGTAIADADKGEGGLQAGTFGVNVFATIADALAALPLGGTLIVNSGTYSETVAIPSGVTMEITGPDAAGAVTITELSSVPGGNIVIEGSSVLTVNNTADQTIAGVISGTGGLVKDGAGILTLSGSNTYTGDTDINGGTLTVNGEIGSVVAAGTVTLAPNTTLSGSGRVNAKISSSVATSQIVATGDLELGDGSGTGFSATNATLNVGSHSVTIFDSNTATMGDVELAGGTLTAANGFNFSGGDVVAGEGTLDGDVELGGATIDPAGTTRVITITGDLDLAGGTYAADVDGISAGQFSQLKVEGTVDISGATLDTAGSSISTGAVGTGGIVLIDNDLADAVTGEFAGLSQGALVTINGQGFTINYAGGDGNDVVLEELTPEIDVQGNGVSIGDGDTTPDAADDTDFGTVVEGGDNVVRTFTIRNTGPGALDLTGSPLVAISGSSDFTITTQPATDLVAAAGSTTFQVTFDPTTVGTQPATITIARDDADEAVYTFEGSGVVTLADAIPPTFTSIERKTPAAATTAADTLVFLATFSEDVQSVDPSDFVVNGTTTATVTGVNQLTASTYEITVGGGDLASFDGVVGVDLAAGQNIADLAGNALPAGEPAIDETYTVDNAGSTPVITPTANPADDIFNVTIDFGEEVNGFGHVLVSWAYPSAGASASRYTRDSHAGFFADQCGWTDRSKYRALSARDWNSDRSVMIEFEPAFHLRL